MTPGAPSELRRLDCLLTEVPRLDAMPEHIVEESHTRMLPSLTAAHAAGDIAISCWIRSKPGGQVRVLVGGSLSANRKPDSDGHFRLNFPAGSRARELRVGSPTRLLDSLGHWEPLLVGLDAMSVDSTRWGGLQTEDIFALLPDLAMAIGVTALPVAQDRVGPYLEGLSDDVERLQQYANGQGAVQLQYERKLNELRRTERWASLGLWEVGIWVGASSSADCGTVAGLLSSSSDLTNEMIRVRAKNSNSHPLANLDWNERTLASVDALSAVMRSPVRELPGIRLIQPLDFDVTPEVAGGLTLGHVLDATGNASMPFSVSTESVNRHVFVTGATGSGKSQTVRALLEQVTAAKIPWLVIEPAKSEYARLAGRLRRLGSELTVIRPGQVNVPPASLNPLEPGSVILDNPRRRVFFNLQTHVDLVRALFLASFEANEPFPQILARALTMSYERLGWNLALGRAIEGDPLIRPRFPNLGDLQRSAVESVEEINYANDVRDNVRGFVEVRIGSLRLGTPGRFFENGHPLDLQKLLKTNVVFEIEDIGDDNDKAFFIGTVLIRLFEILRLLEANGQVGDELRHVTVIEEAHRLLRNVDDDSPSAHAVSMFANLLAEVRAYGEGIVVAEQIPAKVIPDVVKNSAIKLMHRLPSYDDRHFVGATMNLSQAQSEVVVALKPGVAVAHADGMDNPVLVAIDATNRTHEAKDASPPLPPLRIRSSSCPDRCKTSPCTLEELVEANQCSEDLEFALWSEIILLGHLMGEPCGTLTTHMNMKVRALKRDRARCAMGLATSSSISRRSRWIRLTYDPRRLEVAVAEAMYSQAREGIDLGRPDPKWQISRFRWADVRRELDSADEGVKESDAEYILPPEWSERGLVLPVDGSWSDVRGALQAVESNLETPFPPTFLGEPNALDHICAQLVGSGTRSKRLDAAVGRILTLPNRWPSYRLYPQGQ